ncbi:MAG TPA: hypothetical protein VN823_27735 [Stellaceae bacterium]|nr:hypothetical protein [Stellaceae bacterium]
MSRKAQAMKRSPTEFTHPGAVAASAQQTPPFRDRLTATINDTLAYTGLGKTSFYASVKAGRIKITKVGRRTLVDVRSVVALLDLGASPASAPVPATTSSLASRRQKRADSVVAPILAVAHEELSGALPKWFVAQRPRKRPGKFNVSDGGVQ